MALASDLSQDWEMCVCLTNSSASIVERASRKMLSVMARMTVETDLMSVIVDQLDAVHQSLSVGTRPALPMLNAVMDAQTAGIVPMNLIVEETVLPMNSSVKVESVLMAVCSVITNMTA